MITETGGRHSVSQQIPFKGLTPYTEEDAPYFFSRDVERDVILGNIMAARLLLFYGPSGVGKSSILHAGVLPVLRGIAESNRQASGLPEVCVAVIDKWRDDPMTALNESIVGAVRDALGSGAAMSPPVDLPLQELLRDAADRIGGEMVIILDQFEEFFLYHGADESEGSFYTEFPKVVEDPSLPIRFLLSVREDALAELDLFKGSISNLFSCRFRLDYLDQSSARAAILGPIARYNEFHPQEAVEIEEELVETVLTDVRIGQVEFAETGQAGREGTVGRIATPYLQLAMQRLWEEEMRAGSRVLRLSTLQDPVTGFGGVKQIVLAHLDRTLSSLPRDQQGVAAEIFRYLVTRSGMKYAYSIRDLADPEQTGLPAQQISEVVTALSGGETRILSNIGPPPGSTGTGADRYQIYHDVLAPAVLDWRRRFVGSLEKEEIRGELEERARREEEKIRNQAEERRRRESERHEQRHKRLLRQGLLAISAAVLALVAVGLFAIEQSKNAQRERSETQAVVDSLVQLRDSVARHLEALNRAQVNTLDAIALTQHLEGTIEMKQREARTDAEEQLLTDLRVQFDALGKQFDQVNADYKTVLQGVPAVKPLDRDRVWIAILTSGASLEGARAAALRWKVVFGEHEVAVYRSPNRFFAVALPGDGSFTAALEATSVARNAGARDAFFASAADWGPDLLATR
jgi:hypothetical protein